MGNAGADLEYDEEDCCHAIIDKGLAIHRHSDVLRRIHLGGNFSQFFAGNGDPVSVPQTESVTSMAT